IVRVAARPLRWVGGGAARAGAGEAVQAIAQRLAAPVIETFGARGLVSPDHPCCVGYAPHFWEVGDLWDEADAVLAIGTDFDGTMTQNWAMPQPPALVSINVSGADAADRNYRSDVALVGDARETAGRLFDKLAGGRDAQATRIRLAGLRARPAERLGAGGAAALARSVGVPARRVASPGEPLRDALAQAIGAGGPTVLVLEAALGPPPNTSP